MNHKHSLFLNLIFSQAINVGIIYIYIYVRFIQANTFLLHNKICKLFLKQLCSPKIVFVGHKKIT